MGGMTSLSGLDDTEAQTIARVFGVELEQVRRDHLISLILAALGNESADSLVFFGTALARTHLPHGRLSEHIDLVTSSQRAVIAQQIQTSIHQALRRTHRRPIWNPPLDAARHRPRRRAHRRRLTVRIQLPGPRAAGLQRTPRPP